MRILLAAAFSFSLHCVGAAYGYISSHGRSGEDTALNVIIVPEKKIKKQPSYRVAKSSRNHPCKKNSRKKELRLLAGSSDNTLEEAIGAALATPLPGNPPLLYPQGARQRGEEGRVILRILVDCYGRCKAVEILESSGFKELDQAACDQVIEWRFQPAFEKGAFVEAEVFLPVRFSLKDAS